MKPLAVEIEVERRIEPVFEYFVDHERLAEWVLGLKSFEPISGGAREAGSSARIVVEEKGFSLEFIETVVSRRENSEIVFELSNADLNTRNTFTFASKGDGTVVRVLGETTLRSMRAKLGASLLRKKAVGRMESDLARFKGLLEDSRG